MHDSPFVVNHTIVRFKKNEVERGVMMSRVSYTVKLRYLELDGTVWKLRDNRVCEISRVKYIYILFKISVFEITKVNRIWHTQGYV